MLFAILGILGFGVSFLAMALCAWKFFDALAEIMRGDSGPKKISRPKAAGRSKAMEKRNTEKIKRIALKLFEQLKGECVTYEEGRCIINALHARLERAADDMVIK